MLSWDIFCTVIDNYGDIGVTWRLAHARLSATPGQAVVAGAGVIASVALAVSMACCSAVK